MDAIEFLTNLSASTLRLATPLLLAAMAGLLSHQVGLINIALEGMMLAGAFIAVVVGFNAGSAWIGVLAAMVICTLLGALFALFVTDLRANLIVAGLAMNFLALGVTGYILQVVFGKSGTYAPTGFESLPNLNFGVLSDLPVVGRIFFSHSPLVYVSWIVIPLTALFLYRTTYGIYIRAVGENPEAAQTAGISVRATRYLALMLGGLLCGIAGAHLSVGDLALFREDMTGGRGFIALAAVYFAAGHPRLSAIACLLFGLFQALQFRLQTVYNVPPQFFQMLPYLMVVMMLVLISIRREWKKGYRA